MRPYATLYTHVVTPAVVGLSCGYHAAGTPLASYRRLYEYGTSLLYIALSLFALSAVAGAQDLPKPSLKAIMMAEELSTGADTAASNPTTATPAAGAVTTPVAEPANTVAESAAVIADSVTVASAVEPDAESEPSQSYRLAVNFEANSLEPTPLSSAALDSMSAVFAKHTRNRYEVHGYTCPAAGQKKMARLSAQRVERVVGYLIELGVPGENIVTIVNTPKTAAKDGCSDDRLVDIISTGARWRDPEPVEPEPPKTREVKPPEPEPNMADSLKAEMIELKRKLAEAERPEPRIAAPESPASQPVTEQPPAKQTVAVYMAGKEPGGAKGVHNIMGGELARVLSESDKYTAVDRTEAILEQLDREHAYQRSGAVDDAQIKAIGHQLGVQYLCISNINVAGRSYYLDTRLVDVVTAEIARSVTATSGLKDANEMSRTGREIALELLENEKTLRQRKLRKTIFRVTAISLDILGAAALAYGYAENNNVVINTQHVIDAKHIRNGSEADRAATRRNAAYIAAGVLIASGVSIHIVF